MGASCVLPSGGPSRRLRLVSSSWHDLLGTTPLDLLVGALDVELLPLEAFVGWLRPLLQQHQLLAVVLCID